MTKYFILNLTDDSRITAVRDDGAQAWLSGPPSDAEHFQSLTKELYEALWKGIRLWPSEDEFGNFSFELGRSAKATSFMSFGPHFFGVNFLVDYCAKEAFSKLNIQEHRMYPVSVYSKAGNLKYWMFYIHQLGNEVLDFERSTFYTGNRFVGRTTCRYASAGEYKAAKGNSTALMPDVIALGRNADQSLDLFHLPIEGRLIVSSRFMKQLEECGCVGHSLSPIESTIEDGSLLFRIPLF